MTRFRQQVARAFSSAQDYDANAHVQRRVAQGLAERVAALDLPENPHVLEIGCGTGFLTEPLAEHIRGGEWLVTDLSPAMLGRARRRLGARPGWRYAVLDGEHGTPEGRFDLIVSSMTLQWFENLPAAVARMRGWLRPGGVLVFTTLAADTFAEWRAAHEAEGLTAGAQPFPSPAQLAAILPQAQLAPPQIERLTEPHDSARGFLLALKAIGAGTAAPDHRPLPAGALRRVMQRFEEAGASVTYEVATCLYGATA